MAIGTAAAIGLGVAGVGAALGASSSKKAANKAADTSMAVAQQNNALAREIYGQNQQTLSPFVNRGNVAGDTLNALLGLGGTAAPQQQQVQPNALSQFQGGQMPASYGYGLMEGTSGPFQRDMVPQVGSNQASWLNTRGGNMSPLPGPISGYGGGTFNMDGTQVTPVNNTGMTNQQAANNAFDIFRNSTNYQFRLGEGINALNSGYAGAGVLQSGDAMRAATEYGQNFASNELNNYMGLLGNQQGVGLSAAGAQAGVGLNYVGQVSQNNNNAGSAAANAALVKGQNNPFANALGMVGGGLLGGAFG